MKKKEEDIPHWKDVWNRFNETKLGWLENFVDKMIPWLVLLLLIIILGEFSHQLNFFSWQWVETVAEFFTKYSTIMKIVDQIVVTFFVIDLYFNFFKKATVWSFIKTSFLDILAVAPLGLLFRVAGLGEVQSALHIEKEVTTIMEEKAAVKLFTVEEEAAKLAKLQKAGRATYVATRVQRFTRLHRLSKYVSRFFGKREKR